MDNTIKLNFLKFSEGSLENEKSKKNLLTSEEVSGKSEEGSKFILVGTETVEKISIGEVEKTNKNTNNLKLDKNNIKKKVIMKMS